MSRCNGAARSYEKKESVQSTETASGIMAARICRNIITHRLICEPADDERIPFWNIACGEKPVVLCDDPLKAAPCKETFALRMRLAVAVTFAANVVHLHTAHKINVVVFYSGTDPGVYTTYWETYCWTLNELSRAPLLVNRSASFPISIASSVIFEFWKLVEANALAMAVVSRNAAVRLFWPKLTPHMICVP